MAYDGFGNFTRDYNFTQDKVDGIKIQSTRVDAEFDNFATGMNEVILRSGVVPMGGNLKMGGYKVTGLAAGTADAPSLSPGNDLTSGVFFPSAGVAAISANGDERARADSNGFKVTGLLTVDGFTFIEGAYEKTYIAADALSGQKHLDVITQAVYVLTANATANFTFNVRGDNTTDLDDVMEIGQSISIAIEVPQGATAYYCTAITVDGNAASQTKWFGGGAPIAGNVSGIDVYAITVIKTDDATFLVRASQTQMK